MAGGFRESKVNPKFLHANSTSHTWPFSAIAELIDNAYDPDVSASQLWIDKEVINGKVCLTFVDDGNGMDLDHLHKMLSLGYCEKDTYETRPASHKPIGQYGNGFKSGSMRLAKDALVLTVHKEADTACVGLLSLTLCSQRNLDTVILPLMEFTLPDLERSCNADLDMDRSLEAILEVSHYSNEDELKEELRKISKQKHGSGTKIVLFNLKRNKNGMLELDFESDPADIRNPETLDDDEESSRQRTKVFEYRQSLRRYCSILYLTPKMEIFIRKERVQTISIKKALSLRRTMKYRPRGKNETEITFGRSSRRTEGFLEDYGMMLYHRNRLITPYVKLGCQTKTDDSRGGEVVGVVDFCGILQPTHNKQEFLVNTVEHRTAMSALAKKLDQYCRQIDHHGDTEDEDRNTRLTWVQCDRCKKWRLIPITVYEPVPKKWYCHMNPDRTKNRCDFPQEEFSDEETDTPSSPGSSSMSSGRGRGRGGRGRRKGIKPAAILHFDKSDSSCDASEQESDCVQATAAPTTPATTSQGSEVVSRRKRKQPAYHRTVGDKRARSIRDVKGQGHRVGVRGMRDVHTFPVQQSECTL